MTQEEGFVKVVSPIDGTPADEAGMEAGYQFGWSAALDNLAKEFCQ